jgi:hypothetical protein
MNDSENSIVDSIFRAKMIEEYNNDPGPNASKDPGMFGYAVIAAVIIFYLMSS